MTDNNNALFITFRNAVAQKLVERGFLPEMPADLQNEPAIEAAITGWYADGNNPEIIVKDIANAIISVHKWIDEWEGYQEQPLNLGKITVALSLPLKVGAATFTLEGWLPDDAPATALEVSKVQVRLYDILKQAYDATARRRSAAGVAPNASATDKATGLPEVSQPEEIVIVKAVYMATEKGRFVVKFKGGQYMAHGVNCYPEVYEEALKEIGRTIDDFKHGHDTPIRGKMAVVQGEKAKKVTRLKLLPN